MAARNAAFHSRDPLKHEDGLQFHHATGPFTFLNPTRARFAHDVAIPTAAPLPASGTSTPTGEAKDVHKIAPEQGSQGGSEKSGVHSTGDSSSERRDKATENSEDKAWRRAHPHEQRASAASFQWRSRDNRKGRHTLVIQPSSSSSALYEAPEFTDTPRAVLRGIWAMCTQYPYWNVSWLVAVMFTLGSVIWVINAFFVWLPLVQPATEFTGETTTAGGWSAFVGATIFEIGSVLLMIEAVNENRAGCFGWALEEVVEELEGGSKIRIRAQPQHCHHHHRNRKNFVGKGQATEQQANDTIANGTTAESPTEADAKLDNPVSSADRRTWQWIPSWHDLTTHYIYELGFIACSAQMFGATVFWISGFTAIPSIYNLLPTQAAVNEGYWVPQMVGGSGFIVSSACFMLETQPKWYIPAPNTLGWHIGLWNMIGALGFTLCGALGPAYANSGAQFEASLATFWGSWAFLIGSVIQWYESLDTHPVEQESKHNVQNGGANLQA